ncbi:DedA family protein [Marinicrinis sediminis]|uniref:DedA family protein n=1 Tax=Marinicrinis sediminis TaxID=1652465 RepID=A0ABW5RFX5_9BACL
MENWFEEYGYLILFVGLFLEFVFLPFPGELVMGYSGVMSYRGDLNYFVCILLAGLGTSMGMTITYFIGRAVGYPFFEKYGAKFFMGPKQRKKVQKWFNRYGNKLLFISYFLPGIRHFTGYFGGIMSLEFRSFIIYVWSGAFTWVVTYVSLGYLIGPKWERISELITRYALILTWTGGLIAAIYLGVKIWKARAAQRAGQQEETPQRSLDQGQD